MSSHELTCPIWGDPPNPSEIGHSGQPYNVPRAGGRFTLKDSGAVELKPNYQPLTDRQRANLSYWIYRHNLDYGLFDESPEPGEAPPVLDKEWVERHRDCTPSPSDQMLAFLRELIRRDDADKSAPELLLEQELHMAACGCRDCNDLAALYQHARKQDWVRAATDQNGIPLMYFIHHSARIHVEEQLREADKQLREHDSRERCRVQDQAQGRALQQALLPGQLQAAQKDGLELVVQDQLGPKRLQRALGKGLGIDLHPQGHLPTQIQARPAVCFGVADLVVHLQQQRRGQETGRDRGAFVVETVEGGELLVSEQPVAHLRQLPVEAVLAHHA